MVLKLGSVLHIYSALPRATYDYEKKLYNDHLESLQVMEKNYVTMAREVEKIRADLTNTSNFDRPTGIGNIR